MDVNVIINAIQQVGFPIVVAIYLIWRHEHILQKLTEKINQLEETIIKLNAEVEVIKRYVDNDNRQD